MAQEDCKCKDVEGTESSVEKVEVVEVIQSTGPTGGVIVRVIGDVKRKRSTAGRNVCANEHQRGKIQR